MKVLVVGGGGREHALVWKVAQSPRVSKIYCAPGNAGISGQAECLDISANDVDGLAKFALEKKIDLTIIGPEEPMVKGLADRFEREGLPFFGLTAGAAQLEGRQKVFAKELMRDHGIPTADFAVFSDSDEAKAYIKKQGAPIVVKADGLAAGKGVFPCRTPEEALSAVDQIMVERIFGDAGDRIVVEAFLEGEEASFLAFTDGETIVPFPSSQDHKAIFEGDKGPNTGGMGAYAPAPVVTPELHDRIMDRIMRPTVRAMKENGYHYIGVLYAGVMISGGDVNVLEFNVRFGDPEAQPLLMLLKSDLVPILQAAVRGRLSEADVQWEPKATVCVVMASKGYPGSYEKGFPITGIEKADEAEGVKVFHAGTSLKDGKIVTSGGACSGLRPWAMTSSRPSRRPTGPWNASGGRARTTDAISEARR